MPNLPQLAIAINPQANQLGPDPGVPITIGGTYSVSGDDYNVDSVSAMLSLQPAGAITPIYNYALTLNSNDIWSRSLNTPIGGPLTVKAVLTVTYEEQIGNPKTGYGSVTKTISRTAFANFIASASNARLAVNVPAEGQLLIGTDYGSSLNVSGTASSASAALAIASVTWRILRSNLSGSAASLPVAGAPPYSKWMAMNVPFPPGRQTIVFTATDNANPPGVAQIAVDVLVAIPADILQVDPSSYLQALIEFATKPANNDGSSRVLITDPGLSRSIAVGDLEGALAQHLNELLLVESSRKANEQVHHSRVCIEVLRNYLALRWQGPTQLSAEAVYRRAAYEEILSQIGTSFEEVRLARSYGAADQDKRLAIADRLGIILQPNRPDNLDNLLLDPDAAAPSPLAITEKTLERFFGLVDSTRDPLSGGPVLSVTPVVPVNWVLDGVVWGVNTDREGLIYVNMQANPGAPGFQVDLYSDSGMGAASLVASGNGAKVQLFSAGNSGLTGTMLILAPAGTNATFQISVVPRFLSWQLQQLRALWSEEDFPADAAATVAPLIDPDLLARGDFAHPATNPSWALFTARQAQVQTWLTALQQKQATGLDAVLQTGIQKTSADLLALNATLQAGEDIAPQLAALNLNFDGFAYLVRICNVVSQSMPLLASEWSDVFSILIQAQKQAEFGAWRTAEKAAGLTLGPDYFVFPRRPPDLFATGLDQAGSSLNDGVVDPHWTCSMPTKSQGQPTYATKSVGPAAPGGAWLANSQSSRWISPQPDESTGDDPGVYRYFTTFDLTGFDPMSVRLALQVAVDNDLVSINLNGEWLPLGASGFGSYTVLQLNDGFVSGINKILFVVNNLGSTPNPSGLRVELSFSSPPAPAAPDRWRAPADARQAWETTLLGRIDQQQSLVNALQSAIRGTEDVTLTLLRDALISVACHLSPFSNLCSTGVDPTGIPAPEGAALSQTIWKLTARPTGAVPASVYVTQNRYPTWVPNSSTASWISPSASENPGDAPGNYTYETDFTVIDDPSRILLKVSLSADDTVTAVRLNGQPVVLPAGVGFTSPTLFMISGGFTTGSNKFEFVVNNAGATPNPTGLRVEFFLAPLVDVEWLGERLSIDFSSSNTQTTTRLTQAIESLQTLLAAVRSSDFLQMSPQPDLALWQTNAESLSNDVYDVEWNWMGSYATWRGVMLSFLFPENLLKPGLLAGSRWSPSPTAAFVNLIGRLRTNPSVTREYARQQANQYLSELRSGAQDASGNVLYALPSQINNFVFYDPGSVNLTDLQSNTANWMSGRAFSDVVLFWEALYFVPIALALQLQQAGQFDAALAWFRTVYDIGRPLTQNGGQWNDSSRKIFYGLATEQMQSQFIRIPGTLTEFDNPHEIAAYRAYPYTRFTLLSIISCLLDMADTQFSRETGESVSNARNLYEQCVDLLSELTGMIQPVPGLDANPQLMALQQRALNNLTKMRSNRNIAGMILQFQLFGEQGLETVADRRVSLQPTQYRYSTLVDRAKQFVTLAQQIETSYLSALASSDNETYNLMKARADLNVTNATVILLADQVALANDGITVAQDQLKRAQDEQSHYQDLINAGLSDHEKEALGEQLDQFRWGIATSLLGGAEQGAMAGAAGGPWGAVIGGIVGAVAAVPGIIASASGQHAQFSAQEASFERREQEWEYQLQLAGDDITTSTAQVASAKDQLAVAQQQQQIASIQQTNAQDAVNFLANKFTNADLYDWMSGVLSGVYRFFLQQATSLARLAEDQLAFERQQPALSVIQPDYWMPLSDLSSGGSTSSDRRGLTGAERLLEDVTQLDQYAFATDQRKLQLTKTISLSQLDPFAFQQFRETGVLVFSTPGRLFDLDFPGHFVRLVSTVRTSVVALIPPAIGIRATLSNKGVSRAVSGVPSFQPVLMQRSPESIGLSSALNASGIFELDPQPQLLRPFENLGVDTSWRFEMARAANPFDYNSIADILFSIDYTALYSSEYKGQVLQEIDPSVSADQAYSFRQQFADAWYQLNNSSQSATPMKVQFQTLRTDFPPNVEDSSLAIAQVLLYFAPANGKPLPVQPTATLTLAGSDPGGNPKTVFGTATAIDGVMSTRRASAANWKSMRGLQTIGTWTLDMSNPDMSNLFQSGSVEDVLFVITFAGRMPAWPG